MESDYLEIQVTSAEKKHNTTDPITKEKLNTHHPRGVINFRKGTAVRTYNTADGGLIERIRRAEVADRDCPCIEDPRPSFWKSGCNWCRIAAREKCKTPYYWPFTGPWRYDEKRGEITDIEKERIKL